MQVFEQGEVGSHPLAWGHVRMFTPWRMNLGKHSRAHLEAAGWTAPDPEACPTGLELAERYLQPLAHLPELAGRIHPFTQVVQASRHGLLRGEGSDAGTRRAQPFRLLVRDQGGRESFLHAFALVDASGVYANPDWAGTGGIPARGELYLRPQMAYHVEDVLGPGPREVRGPAHGGDRRGDVRGDHGRGAGAARRRGAGHHAWRGSRARTPRGIFPERRARSAARRGASCACGRARSPPARTPAVTHVGGAEVEEFEFNSATHRYRVHPRQPAGRRAPRRPTASSSTRASGPTSRSTASWTTTSRSSSRSATSRTGTSRTSCSRPATGRSRTRWRGSRGDGHGSAP